jgi:hypothetical protein
MEIVYVVLSSAAVSGLVTLLTGQYFEHRRYLQNRKLAIYIQLIEEIDNLFDSEPYEPGVDQDSREKLLRDASTRVHVLNRKVRLLTKNEKIKILLHEIVVLWERFLERDFQLQVRDDLKIGEDHIKAINQKREEFIKEANKEINSWL